jgi:flagellar basal-body rod modification protein FlgD
MSTVAPVVPPASALPATAASLNPAPKSATSSQSPDFMKLLLAQMQNQNPTSPTSATDYMTQFAQFSTVQGITQLNQSISSLVALQGLTQGVNLIGNPSRSRMLPAIPRVAQSAH